MPRSGSAAPPPYKTPLPPLEGGPHYDQPPCRVMVSGYYGFENLGDELILQVITEQLQALGCEVTVLSADPEQTEARYGVTAISRLNLPGIIKAMITADLFVSGGGGLFQDATGMGSVVYYGGLIELARHLEVPTVFLGQGVGPLRRPWSRALFRRVFKHCALTMVRDTESADLVHRITGITPTITADPVWLLPVPKVESTRREAPSQRSSAEEPWRIGLSLRPWHTLTDTRLRSLAKFFLELTDGSERPVEFLLLNLMPKQDPEILKQFETLMNEEGAKDHDIAFQYVGPEALVGAIARCHICFGMRFHSIILSLLAEVPVYGLIYDPKVANLLRQLRLHGIDVGHLESLYVPDVRQYFQHYPHPDLRPLQESAHQNFRYLSQFIDSMQSHQLPL